MLQRENFNKKQVEQDGILERQIGQDDVHTTMQVHKTTLRETVFYSWKISLPSSNLGIMILNSFCHGHCFHEDISHAFLCLEFMNTLHLIEK